MTSQAYRLLADTLLVVHFAFVAFVVVGFILILVGLLAGWAWVHNRYFRSAHLLSVGVVVLQAWFGRPCFLTVWENALRREAGQPLYEQSFIQHWLHDLLFYEADAWVFTTVYTLFGVLVAFAWVLGRRSRDSQ